MINVCHLYPDLLNLYGDRGNIIAVKRRCQWRGIPVSVLEVSLNDDVDFMEQDFVFIGGGSDREQNLIAADLLKRKKELIKAIENGLVILAICGGYQLLGKYYLAGDGEKIPGLGIMDFYTRSGDKRLVGNVAVEIDIEGFKLKAAGFENHSGQTYLGNCKPLGKVLAGNGNNGKDGLEGARYKNVFCSYLHGPLLPKNARLTDYLINLAIKRRCMNIALDPLEADIEDQACLAMLGRLGFGKITN
ncbi:glutamine amidotransferase [Pelotomaculum terephthalicicum JT]|uniref:type 1 glutamine amidotransferase n=1 Tax=Pelotomaculum TaxID=191373 RepID=UPI0009D0BAB1|nr:MULTISPECIES: glutamine amidotransferase [Pelotomaculum]MCG9968653.1 glutamine amidotransferase [Pelotomaculum terephthalicicum JT]OPX85277.1 MAG: cobyric acid synthase [Pelotomaculum sp. PtaB.Bin117]OPY60408.1 MAG: cobyric acid synthase [Pelotomaculum sp. PtaU1.Bin065]